MSLGLVMKTTEGLLLAADSRRNHPDGSYNDDSQKIFQLGGRNIGVVHAGMVEIGGLHVTKFLAEFERERLRSFASVAEIAEELKQFVANTIGDSLRGTKKSLAFIVAGYDGENPTWGWLEFSPLSPQGSTPEFSRRNTGGDFIGEVKLAQKVIEDRLTSWTYVLSLTEAQRIACVLLQGVPEIQRRRGDRITVGGPAQMALVTVDRFQWISRVSSRRSHFHGVTVGDHQ